MKTSACTVRRWERWTCNLFRFESDGPTCLMLEPKYVELGHQIFQSENGIVCKFNVLSTTNRTMCVKRRTKRVMKSMAISSWCWSRDGRQFKSCTFTLSALRTAVPFWGKTFKFPSCLPPNESAVLKGTRSRSAFDSHVFFFSFFQNISEWILRVGSSE